MHIKSQMKAHKHTKKRTRAPNKHTETHIEPKQIVKQVDKWVHAKPVLSRAFTRTQRYLLQATKSTGLKLIFSLCCERFLIRPYRTRATFHIDLIDFY